MIKLRETTMSAIEQLKAQHTDWDSVPVEQLEEGIRRQMIVGENMMICRLRIAPNVVTPAHDHPHEQMTLVERGRALFTIGDEERIAQAGDMLRLDPGPGRVHTTRSFQVWEGGGEYNVARGLRRCFGLDTSLVTALADNPVGRLVSDLIYQGGVDQSHVRWVKYDGVGRTVRNGLNFTERGFGPRAALGCSDRGHTAVSQLKPGDVDWEKIFLHEGARWFHTGGIFCALSATTPLVAKEAMEAAKRTHTIISYDLNYRASLWESFGGKAKAQEVNRRLVAYADVLLGNEEDFTVALGFPVAGLDESHSHLDAENFKRMIEKVAQEFPNLAVVATT